MTHKVFSKVDSKLADMSVKELIAEKAKALQEKRKVYAGFIAKELKRRS